jgi:hypothetical protein
MRDPKIKVRETSSLHSDLLVLREPKKLLVHLLLQLTSFFAPFPAHFFGLSLHCKPNSFRCDWKFLIVLLFADDVKREGNHETKKSSKQHNVCELSLKAEHHFRRR